jgi:hypothetical protein
VRDDLDELRRHHRERREDASVRERADEDQTLRARGADADQADEERDEVENAEGDGERREFGEVLLLVAQDAEGSDLSITQRFFSDVSVGLLDLKTGMVTRPRTALF